MNFWDASALVSVIVEQTSSFSVRTLYQQLAGEGVVVWTLTPIEFVSAVCRLTRQNDITQTQAISLISEFRGIATTFELVSQVELVKQGAERILHLYPLKAADALQLAAALVGVDHKPEGHQFVSLDRTLAEAALKEGFRVLP